MELPSGADRPIVILLMAVVKADHKVLKEETDLVLSFFSRQLRVPAKRLSKIKSLVSRFSEEEISADLLSAALGKVPETARDILFCQAIEIAIVDDELSAEERESLLLMGEHFGLTPLEVRSYIREAASRREDAFSLLEVNPDSEWEEIEKAYEIQKRRYAPSQVAQLGIAFQNLALERLDRIEWAFETLSSIYHSTREKGSQAEATAEPLQLSELSLPHSFQSRLDRAGIETREQLDELLTQGQVKGMRAKSRRMFEHLQACIRESTDAAGAFHRPSFDQAFPRKYTARRSSREDSSRVFPANVADKPRDLWRSLPNLLEELWKGRDREWDVLRRRIGLVNYPVETLQDIADSYDVSRERIRQLESRGKRRIRNFLLRGSFEEVEAHPAIPELCRQVMDAVSDATEEYVVPLQAYIQALEDSMGWKVYSSQGLFGLFEEWATVSHDNNQECEFVFRDHDHTQIKAFNGAVRAVRDVLTRSPQGARLAELVEALAEFEPQLRCSVEKCVTLAPDIVKNADGSYSAGFTSLNTEHQAFLILREAGTPLALDALASRINERLEATDGVEAESLRRSLSCDDRFQSMESGEEWALTSWEHVETSGILDVLEKILGDSKDSMSVNELADAVRSERSCTDKSVFSLLATEERFLRTGPDRYALASQVDSKIDWNCQEIGELVEEFFFENFQSSVPFEELTRFVAGRVEIDREVAHGILLHHPAVRRLRENGELRASRRRSWQGYSDS